MRSAARTLESKLAKAHPVIERKPSMIPFFTAHADRLDFVKREGREDNCAIMFRLKADSLVTMKENQ